MNHERLDEIRELFKHSLEGSGIRADRKPRVVQLFDRVADAYAATLPREYDVTEPLVEKPRTGAESLAVIAAAQKGHLKAVEESPRISTETTMGTIPAALAASTNA